MKTTKQWIEFIDEGCFCTDDTFLRQGDADMIIEAIQKDAYDYGYLQGMIVTSLSISNGEIKAEDIVKALSRLDELEKRMKELQDKTTKK